MTYDYGNRPTQMPNRATCGYQQPPVEKENLVAAKPLQNDTRKFKISDFPLTVPEKVPLIKEPTLGESGTFELEQYAKNVNNTTVKGSLNSSLAGTRKHEDFAKLPPKQGTLRRKLFNFERPDDIRPERRNSKSSLRASPSHSETENELRKPTAAAGSTDSLEQWVKGVGIKVPPGFTLKAPVLDSFKDGTLLCQLVEKLEHKTIEGVTWAPKSSANCLHNLRMALEVLGKHNVIPLYYTQSAEGIFEGGPELIIGLLKNMRHAYRNSFMAAPKVAGGSIKNSRGSIDSGRGNRRQKPPLYESDWN